MDFNIIGLRNISNVYKKVRLLKLLQVSSGQLLEAGVALKFIKNYPFLHQNEGEGIY